MNSRPQLPRQTHSHGHDHDHEGAAILHTHLTSVGIDIGSSTSHLMFSVLTVGYPSPHHRHPEVLSSTVIGRSSVMLTPFSADWNIDPEPLKSLIEDAFSGAGLTAEMIDTGAVIITGEAARRDNAQRIVELFSDRAGQFVCATAGPKLEAVLAAHGSGAVARSRDEGLTLLHIDVGGGTTKISLISRGRIVSTAALNIGARVLAYDPAGRLVRIEHAGRRFLDDIGARLDLWDKIDQAVRRHLASRMATVLFEVIRGAEPPWAELLVTPVYFPIAPDVLLFSGGVAEYVYGHQGADFGDLGPDLGAELREQALARGYRLLEGIEGIRATVIGASEYSVQLSGETIFIPEPERLPLHNLRTLLVPIDWEAPVGERASAAVREALLQRDQEVVGTPYALVMVTPPFCGYGVAQQLGEGIREVVDGLRPEERPEVLVFHENIGQIVGRIVGILCVDEVRLSELDFIDVGRPVAGEGYVPIVVKSLAFGV